MEKRGHQSEKSWMRYNVIKECDLLQSVLKVQTYLQENTPGTLDPKTESL
jgi:hypothetical protein